MFPKSRLEQDSVRWALGQACEAGWSRLLWQVEENLSAENPSRTGKVFAACGATALGHAQTAPESEKQFSP